MDKLKENEWYTISKILLELYELDDIKVFSAKLLRMFRMLIPYTQGYFLLFDEHERIDSEYSSFLGMEQSKWNSYLDQFFEIDYINYVFDFASDAITYRDTDIIEEPIRTKTEFYQGFLKPQNISYGCGIILIKDGKLLGVINLFREIEMSDFSDKDMNILEILKPHLVNMVCNIRKEERENLSISGKRMDEMIKKYNLSLRETEVLRYINQGYSNVGISEKLVISVSTVKKHIYNIYLKTGVNSRTQLIALIGK